MTLSTSGKLFEELVRGILSFAAARLRVDFVIARLDDRPPIANDAASPIEEPFIGGEAIELFDSGGQMRGTLSLSAGGPASAPANQRQILLETGALLTRLLAMRDRTSRQHEDYFRVLTDNVADLILIVGSDGTHKYVSASVEAILGYRAEERLGRSALENIHPQDLERAKSLLQVLAQGGHVDRCRLRFRHKDGSWRVLELRGTNLLAHPTIHGIVVTASDVTDRRRLEQELEQLNRLSSLGRLAAQVAHEFNNVLMGIQPAVEVLRRIGSVDPQIVRLTDLMASSVGRGKRITTDILRFGRPAQLTPRPLDVEDLFTVVAREIGPLLGAHVRLVIDAPRDHVYLSGDCPQLVQVLVNLANNARDALTPGGGTITIGGRAGGEHTAESTEAPANADEFIHINVTDDGQGIPSENIPYIFEPLFTTRTTGTGLGLSVVYQVVTGHGGHIFVESRRDSGTTFHIFIPRAFECEESARPERPAPANRLSKVRVLIAEDDANVATGLKWVLEAEGMAVQVVGTAADVVPAIEEFEPDVLILDVSLPDADGRSVYTRVAGRIPVIFSTGSADAQDLAGSAHGGVAVLIKPYGIDDLMRAMHEALFPCSVQ